ncbi:ATP-binding protein [Alphaproteobacteria bacterium]|nr:ATP-binding protein [Alphaproteobacteria bacterium]
MSLSIKRLYSSLLLRSFYLISIPIVLIQLIGIFIFFELHWDLVLKKLSKNIVNSVEIILNDYPTQKDVPKYILDTFELTIIKNQETKISQSKNFFLNKRMNQALKNIRYPSNFGVYNSEFFIIIIKKDNDYFNILIDKDKLETKTITGFFLWVLFCSIILSLISYLFIKNQIRPLQRLGIITRSFGRGITTPDIRPTGSTEIRGLIRDFNNMKNNIIETINTQKTMLAGISHDLRTPLTRISLMNEGTSDKKMKEEINSNIIEMNTMIESYIDFIKNEKNETSIRINSNEFINEKLIKFNKIIIQKNDSKSINIKKTQLSRAIQNIIENADKFAENIYINSYFINQDWVVTIEDDGPGTELSPTELIKPFTKGKNSLNQGSGLGLSILKKIIDLNNGIILFEKSKYGGLKVTIQFKEILE